MSDSRLADYCSSIDYGYTTSACDDPAGPNFLRITDIVTGPPRWDQVPYCNADERIAAKFKLNDRDIVVARTGATTGVSSYIREPPPAVFASYLVRLTIDETVADARFASYYLKGPQFWGFMRGVLGDKSAQPNASAKTITQAPASFPPVDEQRAIAGVLGALDDKIEQNRRTARALERLARAIFRAWFVDFEPVRAKAAGATSFPSMPQAVFDALPTRFVDSEIGPVPEGWEVKTFSESILLTMGQSPPSEFYNESGEGLPFHQGVTDYGFRFPTHRVYCTTEGRIAEPEDVLLSVRAPVGRINVADRRLVLGRGLAGLRHRSDRQSFLRQQICHVFAEEDAIGDGTIYKAVTKRFLEQMLLLAPSKQAHEAFENLARPLDDLIAACEVESRKLAETGDLLLPQLLSGQIRVGVAHG